MKKSLPIILLFAICFSSGLSSADDDGHKGKEEVPRATNETYRQQCGSCHFAYQPGLLPARSWLKILDIPDGHVGGAVPLDGPVKEAIKQYLIDNSAEKSPSKRSRKILDSVANADAPTRISDTPYIRKKHHEISEDVFSRKAIGFRGNCIACHKTAEKGNYDDDNVSIPK